jgi:hypothetical protein
MLRSLPRIALLAALALAVASTASADLSKLNPRARVALRQLQAGESAAKLAGEGQAVTAAGDLDVFIVGAASRAELEAFGVTIRTEIATPDGFVRTAFVPVGVMGDVAGLAGVARIEGSAPVELELDASVATTNATNLRGAGPAFSGLNGAGVLVGDVDSGVDYDHGDFEDAAGNSRLVSLWDQTVTGTFPSGFAYGNECTNAQLTAGTCGQLDTDGHGSHVLGIAGGDGSQGLIPHQYSGMAPMADLCMVKTNFQTTSILDGVAYIFGRATALSKNAVVNLSLGSHYGPHDGTSPFESGLSALSGPGRVVVKSAGNERSSTNIRHAQVNAAGAGTNATMLISGSANNRIVGISGWYEATENISVRITTPGGTVIGPLALGGINAAYPGVVTPNGQVYLENGAATSATGDPEIYIEIRGLTAGSANGTWTFTFIPVTLGPANGEVDLWRFFTSTGITGNFVIGADNGTELISEPGNSVEVITTAAWVSKQNWFACNGVNSTFTGTPAAGNLATFSSMGPTRDGRQKPDIAAPGIAIGSTRSFDVAGTCPPSGASTLLDGGNHVINAGTSMAAPHTTGACALIMQKYGAVTPAWIKTFLGGRAVVDGFTGAVPNIDWGYGKLFLGDMIDPTVAVTFPNGGETAIIGANIALQWTASDNAGVTAVDLYLSRSGAGGPWETIATGVPNSGLYNWTATGPATLQAILRVVATDAAGNSAQDLSNGEWEIKDFPVSTLLATFTADAVDGGIELRWVFGDGAGVSDVAVERSAAAAGPWSRIDAERRVDGIYQVALDRGAPAGRTSWYRLVGIQGGRPVTFGPLSGVAGRAITEFGLTLVAPNPTTGPARFEFTAPRRADLRVSILDVQGREREVLADGAFTPGRHQLTWSGDLNGRRAPAGLYFVRVQAEGRSYVKRIAVQY